MTTSPLTATATRRGFLTATVGLLGAAALAACGDSSSTGATGGSSAGTFPVTVEHSLGTTTVPEQPARVVIAGLSEQDIVLALGVVPVGVTEWYGEQPSAVWPWAQAELNGAQPTVLSNADGFQFEKIAALKPDLIVGTNSGMTKADFTKFSAIAPTIPSVKGGTEYFSPWEPQTQLIAEAMGKKAEGEKLIADVKAGYAAAAAANPEFAGKTVTFSQNAFYDGKIYVYPDGLGTSFLTMLGLTVNPDLAQYSPGVGQQAEISTENLSKIDADVLVIAAEKAEDITALEKIPTWNRLGAVSGKHTVYTDPTLSGAMYFESPLSLLYVLEKLTPELKKAVAGQAPATLVGA